MTSPEALSKSPPSFVAPLGEAYSVGANAGLYARVSTTKQGLDIQLDELHRLAARRGWAVVGEYTDVISGATTRRPGLDRLLADAHAGRLDVVVVWKLDRLGRSLIHMIQVVDELLVKANAGFRITTPTHTYRGGPPSTSYQILINQNAVDLGDAATPPDQPSFRNTLSAGDRSTLALAFFLAQLEQDPDRARKIVVFDDPFTSLDGFRRSHTANQIYRCGEACAQVVLLSHEPNFLHLLWERIVPADRKTLVLVRISEEDTTITEWDIERAVQGPYRRDIDLLLRFFSDNDGDPRNVVQKIRPVLEGYCRYVCPTQFGEQDTMGAMVAAIRAAGAAHPLHPVVDDLDDINVYSRRYHHPETGRLTAEPIDDAELQGYVRRTLKLVGGLP